MKSGHKKTASRRLYSRTLYTKLPILKSSLHQKCQNARKIDCKTGVSDASISLTRVTPCQTASDRAKNKVQTAQISQGDYG